MPSSHHHFLNLHLFHGPAPFLLPQLRIIISFTLFWPTHLTYHSNFSAGIFASLLFSMTNSNLSDGESFPSVTVYAQHMLSTVFIEIWCSPKVEWMSRYHRQFIQEQALSALPGRAYTLENRERASHPLPHHGLEYSLRGRSSREQQVQDDEDRKTDLPSPNQQASLWQETRVPNKALRMYGKNNKAIWEGWGMNPRTRAFMSCQGAISKSRNFPDPLFSLCEMGIIYPPSKELEWQWDYKI